MRPVFEILALVVGLFMVAFGAWLTQRSTLPAWMKNGVVKWPLGNNLTPAVIHKQGASSVLIGIACLAAWTLHLFTPRSAAAWSAIAGTVLVLAIGLYFYVGSLLTSRRL